MPKHNRPTPLSIFGGDYPNVVELIILQLNQLYEKYSSTQKFDWHSFKKLCKKLMKDGVLTEADIQTPPIKIKEYFIELDTDQIYADRGEKASQYLAEILEKNVTIPFKDLRLADFGTGNGLIFSSLFNLMKLNPDRVCAIATGNFPYAHKAVKPYPTYTLDNLQLGSISLFDCILLHTVLHHFDRPYFALNKCAEWIKRDGKVIVVESLLEPSVKENHLFKEPPNLKCANANELYIKMSRFEQQVYLQFMDWLFCRVFDTVLDFPVFHHSYKEWKSILLEMGIPLRCIKRKHIGFIDPTLPFFHSFYVLEKIQN